MTRIDFYTGSKDRMRTACELTQKALLQGLRVLLHVPDEASAHRLDTLLWQFPATGFLPHCDSRASDADRYPVILGSGEHCPPADVLITLHETCPTFFSRYERVIEIIDQQAECMQHGRSRYKFYRDRGYALRHIDLSAT